MKIEISLKDLVLYLLVLGILVFAVISIVELRKEVAFIKKVNQINQNSVNIQLLDKVMGQMRQQNVPTYELTPKEKKGSK